MSVAAGDTDERDASGGGSGDGPGDGPGDGRWHVPGRGCVSSLMAVQRRHALRTLAIVVAGLTALLGAALVPGAADARCGPFGWLVFTTLVHPMWLVVAVRHVRAAEQAERDLVRAARRRGRRRAGRGGAACAAPGDPEPGPAEPGRTMGDPDGGPGDPGHAEGGRPGAGREGLGRGRRPGGPS